MRSYVCTICGFTYEEAKGIPELGIAPGTKWEDLPDGFACPWCKAPKSDFVEKTTAPAPAPAPQVEAPHVDTELSPMEMSIICSNLARGCEKQYLAEEAELFNQLAAHFRSRAEAAPSPSFAGR